MVRVPQGRENPHSRGLLPFGSLIPPEERKRRGGRVSAERRRLCHHLSPSTLSEILAEKNAWKIGDPSPSPSKKEKEKKSCFNENVTNTPGAGRERDKEKDDSGGAKQEIPMFKRGSLPWEKEPAQREETGTGPMPESAAARSTLRPLGRSSGAANSGPGRRSPSRSQGKMLKNQGEDGGSHHGGKSTGFKEAPECMTKREKRSWPNGKKPNGE